MRRLSPEAAEALAAEYVLGTLRGRARARFETLAAADEGLAAAIARWQAGLTPLVEGVDPVAPPARVWRAIERRIAPAPAARAPGLGLWKSFGLVAGGLASVLLAAFLWLASGPRGEPLFIAVLRSDDQVPRVLLSMHQPNYLRVKTVKPWPGAGERSLELWVHGREGSPRSLGLVRNEAGHHYIRITSDDPRVRDATGFLVSIEPPGGSPTSRPTGPVVMSGPIVPVRPS